MQLRSKELIRPRKTGGRPKAAASNARHGRQLSGPRIGGAKQGTVVERSQNIHDLNPPHAALDGRRGRVGIVDGFGDFLAPWANADAACVRFRRNCSALARFFGMLFAMRSLSSKVRT